MENLQTNISFNGIHYLEGDDIYIFNDGIQESEKSSKTIIISESSNNYIIEIFKKVIHEITDVYSPVEDQDGTLMDVCFFPTRKQTIYFRVLEALVLESSTSEEEASVLWVED